MSDFSVDLSTLLEPISTDKPAGEWLRYEGTYDQIEQARKEDDATLPQGIWKTTQKRANWDEVARLCQTALKESTKDLQIAAWLLEAWLNKYGWAGLRPGLELIIGLCTNFWDSLYPTLDEGDASYRLAPIEWIDRKLIIPLKRLPITSPGNDDARPYTFAEWEQAQHYEKLIQRGERDVDPGDVTEGRISASSALTSSSFFHETGDHIDAGMNAAEELTALLDKQVGEELGSLRGFKSALHEIRALVMQLSGGEGLGSESEAPAEDTGAAESDEAPATSGGRRHGIQSRQEAYRMLQEAADYLLRTEPHSPTPYLVKRAVMWGSKGLPELLAEIVGTPADLKAIYQLLAIRASDSE